MKQPLVPSTIEKYVNQLLIPPVFKPTIVKDPKTGKETSRNYTVSMVQFKQQILPEEYPKTTVWGYEGTVKGDNDCDTFCFRSTPGPTFEAIRGVTTNVQWINNITEPNQFAVDPTLHWANPNNMPMPEYPFKEFPPGYCLAQSPIPLVTHLHGAEVRSDSDGEPEAWFTAGEEKKGPSFTKSRYTYPNTQEPTTLWYHDHALGTTRLGVYGGLAGFYLIRDPKNEIEPILPKGKNEIPLVIQDRSFYDDGSLLFPNVGNAPEVHPYWRSAFIGDTIMVNGRVWPNLNVKLRQYRFRILNGSNTRTYNLKLEGDKSFIQIGSDGGFLEHPVTLTELLIAPAERAEILIDFSEYCPGDKVLMVNDANAPYPNGQTPDPNTDGQIMQFTVCKSKPIPPVDLPQKLNHIPKLKPNALKRVLTLDTLGGPPPPALGLFLNGQKWDAKTSELPVVGTTEIWEIANLTAGAHPIHVHLIQFQFLNSQLFDSRQYEQDWENLNGQIPLDHPTRTLSLEDYLEGDPICPPENEQGWKDTVLALPGRVTRLILRWTPQDVNPKKAKPGVNLFPFDPTFGPGYVWHCHIVDHEDNEMMRPLKVIMSDSHEPNPQTCCKVLVEGETQLVPPAISDKPISHKDQVYVRIEKVCPETVVIDGFIRRTITYTVADDWCAEKEKQLVDDIPFNCIIERNDANAGDKFEITGKAIICDISSRTQNFDKECCKCAPLAYNYVAKNIVKVCIRKRSSGECD